MKFDVLTLFPALFSPFMEESIVGRAVKGGLVEIRITDIRAFARGRCRGDVERFRLQSTAALSSRETQRTFDKQVLEIQLVANEHVG